MANDNSQSLRDRFYDQEPQPGGSGYRPAQDQQTTQQNERQKERRLERDAREKADQKIREAEASKARVLDPKGRMNFNINPVNIPNHRRMVPDDGYESDEERNQISGNN